MILKAKERGNAPQLARYLLAMRDNDHVELHDVRGFISDDLVEAFGEADAIARGTRCEKHLFSMSFNPPKGGNASIEDFEKAIEQVEAKLGLEGQPRAIVFHEKDGRRHAHAVWSRIDSERMRALNLNHYKIKLRDVSRQLYIDHGCGPVAVWYRSFDSIMCSKGDELWAQEERMNSAKMRCELH